MGWWREAQFARPVRVAAVAPSQAPGEGGGSCKDPKGRSLSVSGESLFGAAGRLDGGRSSWSSVSGSRDLELLQDSGLRGLGESRVMGGIVLVMVLEPRACACCTLKPFRLTLRLSACMWSTRELELGGWSEPGSSAIYYLVVLNTSFLTPSFIIYPMEQWYWQCSSVVVILS